MRLLVTKCRTDSEDILVMRRSRFGFQYAGSCEPEESDKREYNMTKERERECSEGKDSTDAELLKKGLGNVSESELWFRTVGELLVILLHYVQRFLYCSERRDEKYGMKNGTREWKEGDKMNKRINY